MDYFAMVALFAAGLGLGTIIGRTTAISSLLIGADSSWGRTPQKLGEKFYYLVPESEYCELTLVRYRAESDG